MLELELFKLRYCLPETWQSAWFMSVEPWIPSSALQTLDVMTSACMPNTQDMGQENQEFKVTAGYILSSVPV